MPEQERDMEEKEPITAERIKKLVKDNRKPKIDEEGCVDGRYPKDSPESGKLARAGADGGYVEGLLAFKKQGKLNISPREAVGKVVAAVRSTGRTPTFHTDDHSNTDAKSSEFGCGHLGKAADEEKAGGYLVDPEDVKEVIKYVKELAERGEVKLVVLPGKHDEKAVVINDGEEFTIDPNEGELMVFVYDRKRDMDYIENELYPALDLQDITVEEFKDVLNTQTGATVHNLASGMPQFLVNADLPDQSVQELGIAA